MGDKDDNKGDKVPPAFLISRQLDQEKINFLTKRIEELLKSNNELRSGASQNEKDTHDIVLYFQREMEIKDDIILKLNEELVKCQTQLKFEVERVRKNFEEEMATVKGNAESTIASLTSRIQLLEDDLKAVDVYRREKDQHEEIIQKLERSLKQQRDQLIDAMEEQERRFLEEKAALFKELDEQKAAFREVALNEARAAMGEEVKKILADNSRMFEELKFHHAESVHIQAEKKRLQAELLTSKREVAILADKEIEYAKQAHNRSKEIKTLRERVDVLEKQQAANIEKFKLRAKELKSTVTKELEEATLDAAGLRRLIAMKNKELKHMKALAATILSQRTETEQFFLEALQEVREIMKIEKKRQLQAQQEQQLLSQHQQATTKLAHLNNRSGPQSGVAFPPLNIRPANIHLLDQRKAKPDMTMAELEKIAIADMSWDDKELVLRVLFAKMNGQQPQRRAEYRRPVHHNGGNVDPVFISEGVQLQSGLQVDMNHFEMPPLTPSEAQSQLASFAAASRGYDEEVEYDGEQESSISPYQQRQQQSNGGSMTGGKKVLLPSVDESVSHKQSMLSSMESSQSSSYYY